MRFESVATVIAKLRENRVACISTAVVANTILDAHPDIAGSDCDFYRALTFEKLKDEARKLINKMKLKPELEPDRQLVLPGFNRLQQYYSVEADGDPVALRVDLIPDDQLLQKADELQAMGDGCHEHADELRGYVTSRQSRAA